MGVKLLCGGRQNRFIDLMITQNGKYHGSHFPRHMTDDRHVFEPFCGFLLVIRAEHRIALYSDLRRHPDASAQIRRAPFGHMRVRSLELAGLIDRRIDANIGCELVRRRKREISPTSLRMTAPMIGPTPGIVVTVVSKL